MRTRLSIWQGSFEAPQLAGANFLTQAMGGVVARDSGSRLIELSEVIDG